MCSHMVWKIFGNNLVVCSWQYYETIGAIGAKKEEEKIKPIIAQHKQTHNQSLAWISKEVDKTVICS